MKQLIKRVLVRLGFYKPLPAHQSPQIVERYGNREIVEATVGNKQIYALLQAGKPFVAGKLGSVELSMLLASRQGKWSKEVLQTLSNNAGFFPTDIDSCLRIADLYKRVLGEIDILAVWFNEGEEEIVQAYSPQTTLVRLRGLEPYYHENPWSEALAGKKVLVVHPFAESIARQYAENRTRLFPNPQVLPVFELKVLPAVQSIADNRHKLPFKTWFDALAYMQEEMHKIDFDVAIIGAGAYGLPLASFAKEMGRQAIHMGGATQILFGIFGNRWEKNDIIKGFQNEYWARPLPSEMPEGVGKVENACYW